MFPVPPADVKKNAAKTLWSDGGVALFLPPPLIILVHRVTP